MKIKDLRKKVERLRDHNSALEEKMIAYRNKENIGVCIAECEARASVQCCNLFLAFIEDLAYNVDIEMELPKEVSRC